MEREEHIPNDITQKKEENIDSSHVILRWSDDEGDFLPIEDLDGEGIFMVLDQPNKQWIFSFTKGVSLISRRTALRKANGISKTGYIIPVTKLRVGVECKLVEQTADTDLPTKLREQQRAWYTKKR